MSTDLTAMDLDQEHIEAAAQFAAARLASEGVARVRLAPGDMTEYRIVIARPGIEWAYGGEREGRHYWVTLCAGFGAGYEWHGRRVDGGYAAEKWTNAGSSRATREWTGEVIAQFLTAVSAAMAVPSTGEDQAEPFLRGVVQETGGGGVNILVDRDTSRYPSLGDRVELSVVPSDEGGDE